MPYTPWQRTMSTDPDAAPLVENPKPPEMSKQAPRPRRISGKVLLMPDEPSTPKGSRDRMDPVPAKRPRAARQRTPLPDQMERKEPTRARPASGEGYVRLHVNVEPDGL